MPIQEGNIKITTTKKTEKLNKIEMVLDYEGVDITYNEQEIEKTLQKAPNPYRLMIKNNGLTDGTANIDIYEI